MVSDVLLPDDIILVHEKDMWGLLLSVSSSCFPCSSVPKKKEIWTQASTMKQSIILCEVTTHSFILYKAHLICLDNNKKEIVLNFRRAFW